MKFAGVNITTNRLINGYILGETLFARKIAENGYSHRDDTFFRIGPISPTVLVLCFMPFSNFGTKLRSLGRKCNFKNLTVGTDIDIALTG